MSARVSFGGLDARAARGPGFSNGSQVARGDVAVAETATATVDLNFGRGSIYGAVVRLSGWRSACQGTWRNCSPRRATNPGRAVIAEVWRELNTLYVDRAFSQAAG